jgi:hypothetical protein
MARSQTSTIASKFLGTKRKHEKKTHNQNQGSSAHIWGGRRPPWTSPRYPSDPSPRLQARHLTSGGHAPFTGEGEAGAAGRASGAARVAGVGGIGRRCSGELTRRRRGIEEGRGTNDDGQGRKESESEEREANRLRWASACCYGLFE